MGFRNRNIEVSRGKHAQQETADDAYAPSEDAAFEHAQSSTSKPYFGYQQRIPGDASHASQIYSTDPSQYSRNSNRYHHKRNKRLRNRILIGVGVVLAVFIAFGAALGLSALKVKDQAPELMNTATALKNDLQSENSQAFVSDAAKLNDQITALKNEVNGPLWTIGQFIPVLGEDISAGQKLINVAGELSEKVLMPLSDTLETYPLDTIYVDGNLNGDALNQLCNRLADASPVLTQAAETVDSIGTVHIDQINQLAAKLREPLNTAAQFMSDNGDAFRLIPDILGCNGQRNYLILAQNYSEVRPGGGLIGSVIPLTVSNGKLSFGDPVPGATIRSAQTYHPDITEEEKVLWGEALGSATDVNATPDWSRTGEIFASIWQTYAGSTPDGVIGIDVKTFERLVSLGTNTVALPDGSSVNSADITKLLLHDVYLMFDQDGAAQDAYFAMVLASCMDVIEGKLPSIGLTKVAQTVQQSIQEERLMVWMANPEEEALMEQMGCAGALSYDPKHPEIALSFFDLTWSKIDWYLQPSVTVGKGTKNPDGTTSYPLNISITNTLTQEEAASLPPYVLGTNPAKRDASDMVTALYLFGPAGGSITNIHTEGLNLDTATLNSLDVYYGSFQLTAGQTATITATVTVSKEAEEPLAINAKQNAQSSAQYIVEQ